MKELSNTCPVIIPGTRRAENCVEPGKSFGPSEEAISAESPDLAHSDEIAGNSPQIRFIKQYIDRAAASEATIFITGETGTGKELFAKRIHRRSNRRNRPLISINCAAIPDSLLESELFGFEKGAFTGALSRQDGTFVQADGGTLFLDEIGELSLTAQAKLLRVLEQKEVRPLGSRMLRPIDIRLVIATNHDLEQLATGGKFRQDLLYRLNVIHVHIPPLRERPEDIPDIANHFLRSLSLKYARPPLNLTAGAQAYLKQHPWGGNARELRNVIERVFVFANSEYITEREVAQMCHFATCWHVGSGNESPTSFQAGPKGPAQYRTNQTKFSSYRLGLTEASESELVRKTLEQTKWNKSKAAEILQCSRMTIHRKIAQYHLQSNAPSTAGWTV